MAMSRDRGTAKQKVDQGYGVVCDAAGRPIEDLIVADANQEHGIVARRGGGPLDFAALPDRDAAAHPPQPRMRHRGAVRRVPGACGPASCRRVGALRRLVGTAACTPSGSVPPRSNKCPEKATIAVRPRGQTCRKVASTQAGEFVKEEMDHIREGKHGAKSAKQAIAIGLSKARRAGVAIKPKGEAARAKPVRKSTGACRSRALRGRQARAQEAAPTRRLAPRAFAPRPCGRPQQDKAERSAAGRKAARTRARSSTRP
jgi:hypothetical protein